MDDNSLLDSDTLTEADINFDPQGSDYTGAGLLPTDKADQLGAAVKLVATRANITATPITAHMAW